MSGRQTQGIRTRIATDEYRANFDRVFGSRPSSAESVEGQLPDAVERLFANHGAPTVEYGPAPYEGSALTLRNAARATGALTLLAIALAALSVL